jgi:N4-gp56 family major capsid protein
MGTDENSIIQLKEDLTKKAGDSVTFALVNELTNAGVTGNTTLEGNEEALDARSFRCYVEPLRHAVAVTVWDEQKSAIDLRDAGSMMLKMWSKTKMRDQIIAALTSINGTAYASADATARNAWMVDNVDRVLIGAAKSNYSATHATALANVDNTTDKLTPEAVSLMKRIAQSASPKIRPIRLDDDEEWYVLFVPSNSFRDFAINATVTQANRDARERGVKTNPIFSGGALVWDGVIVREIPEIPTYLEGASSIRIGPSLMCGAQALAIGWAKRTATTTQVRDYGFLHGVGISETRGIKKMLFGSGAGDTDDLKDHGVVTGWFAAVADS